MVQAVYDTFDILPIQIEANAELMSQPNARFVFIGMKSPTFSFGFILVRQFFAP